MSGYYEVKSAQPNPVKVALLFINLNLLMGGGGVGKTPPFSTPKVGFFCAFLMPVFWFFFLYVNGGGGGGAFGQTPRFAEPKCGIVRAVLMPVLWIIPRLLSNPFPFFIHQ